MSARVYVCGTCGSAFFPHRLLCEKCGGRDFHIEAAVHGTLDDFSDRGDVMVGTVRLDQGPIVIARVEGDPVRGGRVSLDSDGDIPVARA